MTLKVGNYYIHSFIITVILSERDTIDMLKAEADRAKDYLNEMFKEGK